MKYAESKKERNNANLLPVTKRRGITMLQKQKEDLKLKLAGRKLRKELVDRGLAVNAPAHMFYLSDVA